MAEETREKKSIKGFVQRNFRVKLILMLVVLFLVAVLIAVVSLLPGRNPDSGKKDQLGLGRDFLFPFVFTDQESSLYVLKDAGSKALAIDDTVSSCVHDAEKGRVYYLRQNDLYEYEIAKNVRKILVNDVQAFALAENRSAVFCIGSNASVKLYDGKKCKTLSDRRKGLPELFWSVGETSVLFLEKYDAETGTAELCRADQDGTVKRYGIRVNAHKTFFFSDSDRKICYYDGEKFCVADRNGKLLKSFRNAAPVTEVSQSMLQNGTTAFVSYDGNLPIRYIVTEIGQENAAEQNGVLVYYNGSQVTELARSVVQILYYDTESDFVLFTQRAADGKIDVRMSAKGRAAQTQIHCADTTRFLFDAAQHYLYYQLADGTLYRYNVYDVDLKCVRVSAGSNILYAYPNKPFVAYTDAKTTDVYLIGRDNSIQRYDALSERRLYGKSDDTYLLLRNYTGERISLDYVSGDCYTRISGNTSQSVFFDKMLENVLFLAEGRLRLWHADKTSEVGAFQSVSAVDVLR